MRGWGLKSQNFTEIQFSPERLPGNSVVGIISCAEHHVKRLFKNHVFISLWPCWVFIAARGLPLVAASRGYSLLQHTGFSFLWLFFLQTTGSRAQAQLLHSMWNLPRPGTEPVSPALAGGLLSTGPPGKSYTFILKG